MKKQTLLFAGMILAVSVMLLTAVSCQRKKSVVIGALSYLRYSEEDYDSLLAGGSDLVRLLEKEGYVQMNLAFQKGARAKPAVRFYDTLEGLLAALKAGEIQTIVSLPQSTALYLCAQDDSLKTTHTVDIKRIFSSAEKRTFAWLAAEFGSDGFSFMLAEKNTALRDRLDEAVAAMRQDGTFERLVKEYIGGALGGTIPKPVALENRPGRQTVRVAVTGDLPPMDYISEDGTFAGFNTAYLAEIGRRLDINIVMVRVSNLGRAAALSSGAVDVVFWTRASALQGDGNPEVTFDQTKTPLTDRYTEEEASAVQKMIDGLAGSGGQFRTSASASLNLKDMPDGTISTKPYFKDAVVGIVLKK
ncbi:MAG: transporter substrate-binding domain-containing protein [Treponema sp.]|nr:transporter substrate-binding domain-containing protein [Treponema sp.]